MGGEKISYCGGLVRAQDPDRFLCSMFAPAGVREDLWALFAFNYEIAMSREVVSETQLGLIRLQWWRERIREIYDGAEPQGNEVLTALALAIRGHDLSLEDFELLLHAREFDLEDVLPGNLEGLVNYLDFTGTPLLRLAVRICGGSHDALQAVAVNYGLAGVLRSIPFHASQRRCFLPEDLMGRYGQRRDHLFEGKPADGMPEIVKAVWDESVGGVVCENRFVSAYNALAWLYLRQIQACGYDVLSPKMARAPAFKALRLLFSALH